MPMHARHKLVWLTAAGWDAAQASLLGAADDDIKNAALARWRAAGWPLVARRRDADASADEVCLGLALPPDAVTGHKLRIALRAPAAGVAKTAPPLALGEALSLLAGSGALAAWRTALTALRESSVGLDLRVYGSLALQALTGQSYLRDSSDIDLLLAPRSDRQLRSGLALLKRYAEALPLDGEIIFPRGEAVAWKEWVAAGGSGARVLVKDADTVRLTAPELLAATLESL